MSASPSSSIDVEVAVEGGRHDARLARHLAQAEGAEALVLQQPQRRVEQRLAGAPLLRSRAREVVAV